MSGRAGGGATLEVADLVKAYGPAEILHGISLRFDAGTITGIAGPNGAGKSTLVKILCGETPATAGTVSVDGIERNQDELASLSAIVHQEPQLYPTLSVAENVVIGHARSRFARPSPGAADLELLRSLDLLAFKDAPVRSVPIAVQQRTEIARALARDARIVLFDEPNSALTEQESEELFDQMRVLADHGRVVLLVSHRLHELVRASDRIVTIKDGAVGSILAGDEITERRVARELADASRQVDRQSTREHVAEVASTALSLRSWRHPTGAFSVDDLTIGDGEIVAFVGVEGSGARELTRSVAGFEHTVASARLSWQGDTIDPTRATSFVPASRQESVFGTLSVSDCLVARMPPGRITSRTGRVRSGNTSTLARKLIAEYGIRCSGPRQPVAELSGGNQQKVILASAVAADPRILVVEEPTRGVDIGSRAEIYGFLRRFAASGHGVILFCTELTEVLEAADRAVVLSRGRIVGEVRVTPELSLGELAETVAELESRRPSAA